MSQINQPSEPKRLRGVTPDVEDNFWSKVDKTPGHGRNGDCWLYIGGKNAGGYGVFNLPRPNPHRTIVASRFAFLSAFGWLLEGACVCHKCDNPPCVNPSHLWIGTRAENLEDMRAKGRAVYSHSMGRPGEANAGARLREADVRAIRERYARGGVSHADLALKFGISRTQITLIIRRQRWQHVS